MTSVVHSAGINQLPPQVQEYFAIMEYCLDGLMAMDIPSLVPKFGDTHQDGSLRYQGILVGCMDPEGRMHSLQPGTIPNPTLSTQILRNKLYAVHNAPFSIVKSMQIRKILSHDRPEVNIYAGSQRGENEFRDWTFGATTLPEFIDDSLVGNVIHTAGIISGEEYLHRDNDDQEGLADALELANCSLETWQNINLTILNIVGEAHEVFLA